MHRFGSLLMMAILTVPIIGNCCLPVTHPVTCHQSQSADDVSCFWNQRAITQSEGNRGMKPSDSACDLPVRCNTKLAFSMPDPRRSDKPNPILASPDLYLQTRALLI
jgi:hypothetical protein